MARHYKWTAVLLPDPARPSLPRLVLCRIPSLPGSPAEPAPEHNSSPCSPFRAICSSSPGSQHGPPTGPAPERKRMKNLRLLMKRREQSGSRWSERVAEDPAHPTRITLRRRQRTSSSLQSPRELLEPAAPWEAQPVGNVPVKKSIRLLMKKRTQRGEEVGGRIKCDLSCKKERGEEMRGQYEAQALVQKSFCVRREMRKEAKKLSRDM
ncbi:uncharacterized protein LOC117533373 [Gymnodraco acuticeps]|uniref:Uncharacterized protein LOC117533373 n=1 Tax=Gymnodraco acuticeps TaxID=8218 RepID=A0A6P8SQI3_GYMAC|nr:uncharacterized protein LOC117533373 [Gymnodraco acuticeps]